MSRLYKLRMKSGLSQRQLAAKCGTDCGQISKYESGERSIDGARLEMLCDLALALNCGIEDIIESESLRTKLKLTRISQQWKKSY